MSKTAQVVGLGVLLTVCLGVGGLGAVFTTPEISGWYRSLSKPAWNPPDSIFGPVWTTLYVLMAIAAWIVWKPAGFRATIWPLTLFALQLTLNLAWSWIFFNQHQIGWAVVDLVALWLAIVVTLLLFFQRSRLAGGLLAPYLAWVSFAGILNFTIWRMNAG